MEKAYRLTLTGEKIPLEPKEDSKKYSFNLVQGSITWQIYKYVCRAPYPVTETQIGERFPGHTIGNKLRKLRQGGYIKDIKHSGKNQTWIRA